LSLPFFSFPFLSWVDGVLSLIGYKIIADGKVPGDPPANYTPSETVASGTTPASAPVQRTEESNDRTTTPPAETSTLSSSLSSSSSSSGGIQSAPLFPTKSKSSSEEISKPGTFLCAHSFLLSGALLLPLFF
jgi:hypothetical protein